LARPNFTVREHEHVIFELGDRDCFALNVAGNHDELVEKLRRLPEYHPDRPRLIWMILDQRGEIERTPDAAARSFAADNYNRGARISGSTDP